MPGRLIVQLADSRAGGGTSDVGDAELARLGAKWGVTSWRRIVPPRLGARAGKSATDRLFVVAFSETLDVSSVAAALRNSPAVEYAGPDAMLQCFGQIDDEPDDPRFPEQWYLRKIRAPQAWSDTHGDSSVAITVIDDGVFWPHEDIRGNLWVNAAEDINHNGRLDTLPPPDGDLDGIDQDGNGYVDDVIGWDFVDNDPNPMPALGDDHGTFCWGASDAATNNAAGIAAPPWNVRGMALRCGEGGLIYVSAAIAAIYYGLGEGAWVFSMSFGSSSPYPPLEQACQAIRDQGALAVAASGSTDPVYPAAYPSVIAVAASDSNDYHAAFSGYGPWVDVCAPGVNIISTTPSGYETWSGTSCATPLASGVLAWMKSRFPSITDDSAQTLLYAWCDSMPDPLYPQGLLGHGRIAMTDSGGSGISEPRVPWSFRPARYPALVRGVMWLPADAGQRYTPSVLLDIAGRKVLRLQPGANDISRLGSGVYFLVSDRDSSLDIGHSLKVLVQR
jgi:subtilisin family serine protease